MLKFKRRSSKKQEPKKQPSETGLDPRKKSFSMTGIRAPSPKTNEAEEKKETLQRDSGVRDRKRSPLACVTAAGNVSVPGNREKSPTLKLSNSKEAPNQSHDTGSRDKAEVGNSCLVVENRSGEEGLVSVDLPPQLRRATHPASPPRHHGAFGPPTEINIDVEAVPPSPMRDPSVSLPPSDDLLRQPRAANSPLESPTLSSFRRRSGSDFGPQAHLWDSERLVRMILGKSGDKPLDSGSVLQAIRAFAMMKQELGTLRKDREEMDGDPPAILTTLTSPTSTFNTSSLSTPQAKRRSRTPSPVQFGVSSPREEQRIRQLLLLTAKKCQTLEQQLNGANQTIEKLQLEQAALPQPAELPNLAPCSPSREPRPSAFEQRLGDQSQEVQTELDAIVANLNAPLPSSTSDELKLKMSSHVSEICRRHEREIADSRQREQQMQEKLEQALRSLDSLRHQETQPPVVSRGSQPNQQTANRGPLEPRREDFGLNSDGMPPNTSVAKFQSLLERANATNRPLQAPRPNADIQIPVQQLKVLPKNINV